MFPLYYCRNATGGWLLSDERPFDAQDLRAQVHHGQESIDYFHVWQNVLKLNKFLKKILTKT